MKRLTREQKRRIQRRRANISGISAIVAIFSAGVLVGHYLLPVQVAQAEDIRGEVLPIMEVAESSSTYTSALDISADVLEEDAAESEETTEEIAEDMQIGYRDDVPLSYDLQQVLIEASEENGIPYNVALGLIDVESGFDPDAVSAAGCYGLTQLNPEYFPGDLSPAENITTGLEYLAYQLDCYDGDMAAALTAYNAGHDTGARWYAEAVLEAAGEWE